MPSCGCKIIFVRFPTYAAPPNATRTDKENLLRDLRGRLSKDKITFFHVTLPMFSIHNHKLLLRTKIFELVEDGITYVQVIKKLLQKYVKDLFKHDVIKPHSSDRAYYPLEKDITNCIHAAIVFGKYSMVDQIQLEKLVEQWIAENRGKDTMQQKKLFLRKCSTETDVEDESSDTAKCRVTVCPR